MARSRFQLKGRLVDPSVNRVVYGSATTQVEPKIMQVLVMLAEHAGEVVSREAMMARVWPDVFVTDDVLNRAIRELRRLFGDDRDRPEVIETIRKGGYRLIAAVEEIDAAAGHGTHGPTTTPSVGSPASAPTWTPGPTSMAAMLLAATIAGASLVWFGLGRPAVPAEAHVRFEPLTTAPGNEVMPALSPTGRLVYVARGGDGRSHLFMNRSAGAPGDQLTRGDGRETAPAWASDDRRVAFARLVDDRCDIWIRDIDARVERRIAPCGTRDDLKMSWSPRGDALAVTEGVHTITAPGRIALLTIATGEMRAVTAPPAGQVGDSSPAFSRDGRRIAFVRSISASIGDIFIATLDGEEQPQRVTFDNADVLGLDWDSDDRHLVFSSERAGGISVWRVATGGGEPTLVAGGGSKLKHPTVARLDGAIAYEEWHYEINLTELPTLDGGAAAPGVSVSRTSDQWNFDPQISPDGTRLAFQSTRSGRYELWVADRGGTNARQLTASSGVYKSMPRWSPDGRHVAYTARTRDGAELVVVDVDSRAARVVATDALSMVAPAWGQGGALLYFGSSRGGAWQIWSVGAVGGDPHQVTTDGGYAPIASPDGTRLYYTRLDRRGLWRRGADGAPDVLVTDGIEAEGWANVVASPAGIFFVMLPDEGDPQVAMVDERTHQIRRLTTLPDFGWTGLSVSADGRRVLYAHTDRREANIVGVKTSAR